MLWPADDNGLFLNFAHVVAFAWSNNEQLQAVIPCVEDQKETRFHLYGVDHITDERLMAMSPAYAVLDDLGDSPITQAGAMRFGLWPHRLRIYTNSAPLAQRCREQLIKAVAAAVPASTDVGGICRINVTGRRLGQSTKHWFAQTTFQPQFTG